MLSRQIAQKLRGYETPFYLYDTALLRQTLESVVYESKKYGYKVHYAIKANYDDHLLAIIREYGLGIDCASGNELRKAIEAGFDPKGIVYAGVGKRDKELRYAIEQDILAIKGLSDVQNYLISEVQKVYRLQGVEINDKHIEVIVRQMCRKVRVTDSGSSDLIGGALANRLEVENINAELQKRIDDGEEGIKLVEYQQVLLGITKAALANESFLSAASFQETTRVLTEAAIKGKVDPLAGLKENVIIGKLIPAGTGLPEVREDLARREAERDAEVAAEQAAAAQQ